MFGRLFILGLLFLQCKSYNATIGDEYPGLTYPIYTDVEANITYFSQNGPNTTIPYSGKYGNDPINQRSALDLGLWKIYYLKYHTYHTYYVYDTRDVAICFIIPDYSYDSEIKAKSMARKVNQTESQDCYFGYVEDASSYMKIEFEAYTDRSTGRIEKQKSRQRVPTIRDSVTGRCSYSEMMMEITLTFSDSFVTEAPPDFYEPSVICRSPMQYHMVFCG